MLSRRFPSHACALLLPLLGLVACGPSDDTVEGVDEIPEVPIAPGETGAAPLPMGDPASSDQTVLVIGGLEGPEAVKYDADQDVYFISNFGPNETDGANDGYLVRADAETGEIVDLRFAVGPEEAPLREPRGMALKEDSLWVADATGLHAFHRETGEHLRFVDLTGLDVGFLNDVAVGPDGAVYVTDMGNDRVLRIVEGGGEVAVAGEEVGNPNGITRDPATGEMVIVTWGADAPPIRGWNPGTGEIRMRATTPGGRYDGVEFADGWMIVASQVDQALHAVLGGSGVAFQSTEGRPADIAWDSRRDRIAVPYIALDRVDVFRVPR